MEVPAAMVETGELANKAGEGERHLGRVCSMVVDAEQRAAGQVAAVAAVGQVVQRVP